MPHWSREFREWSDAWRLDPPPCPHAAYALAAAICLPLILLSRLLADVRE
jgi:hypothetical protein